MGTYKDCSEEEQKLLRHKLAGLLQWLEGKELKKCAKKTAIGLEADLEGVVLPKGKDEIKGKWAWKVIEESSSDESDEDEDEEARKQKMLLHKIAAFVVWIEGQGFLETTAGKLSKGLKLDVGGKLPKADDIKGKWKFVKSNDYETDEEESSEEEESEEEESSSEEEEEEEPKKKPAPKKKEAKKVAEESGSEEESSSEEEEETPKKKKPAPKKKAEETEDESSSGEEESSSEEEEETPKKKKPAPKKKPKKEESSSEEESSSSEEEETPKKKPAAKKKKKIVVESSSSEDESSSDEEKENKKRKNAGGGGLTALAALVPENNRSSFQMFKKMEKGEEHQKLKMAGFLRELQKMAKEEKSKAMRDALDASTNHGDDDKPSMSVSTRARATGNTNISLAKFEPLTEISKEDAFASIEAVLEGRGQGDDKLDGASILQLAKAAIEVLGEQESVVDLREQDILHTTVVGDLHGSLDCLKCVLELVGLNKKGKNAKEKQVVVFDGDYVDRGDNSLEVLCTLLLLKLSHPDQVHLLRGNHEDTMTANIYGFRDEIDAKYEDPDLAEEIWYEFGLVFAAIPICAWTKNAAIMHGGIPSAGFSLERIKEVSKDIRVQIKTVADPYDDDEFVIQGVMWSDPSPEEGITPNDRGGGSLFGPDITEQFLDDHDIRFLIRAHEPFEEGTDHQDVGDGRGCVTVFSASNYPNGEGTNLGAILHLDETKGTFETCTFNSLEQSGGGAGTNAAYEGLLKTYVDDNRSTLAKKFRKVEGKDGTVTPEQWAKVVGKVLALEDVDWMDLQPRLAPDTDGKIHWSEFLAKHSSKLPGKDLLEESQLSLLHKHKDIFLNIFQLLDADGGGTIDKKEFVEGINMLNDECEGDAILKDPENLWKLFDVDGDGEISIEEFCQGLEQSAAVQGITEKLDSSKVQSLQANHEMLLLAFKYLDTDKSGAIDREEFGRGVTLLNKRLPERSQLGDPEELFTLLDADGNGEIDMNEFNAMFRAM